MTKFGAFVASFPVTNRATGVSQISYPPSSLVSQGRHQVPFRHVSTPVPLFSVSIDLIDAATATPTPLGVYEAVLPQTETLIGMGAIALLSIVACWVWANQVVPVSRTKLAMSKARGPVKEYLEELQIVASGEKVSTTQGPVATAVNGEMEPRVLTTTSLFTDATISTGTTQIEAESEQTVASPLQPESDRAFERWLFTDWLVDNKSDRKSGRQKPAALPILKNAKWNSGDNPVLVATALIGLGVMITSITERVSSLL
jgi:hypothetical protein